MTATPKKKKKNAHVIIDIINGCPTPILSLPLILITLLTFRHAFPHYDGHLPPWEYLWDDRKNFVDNVHLSLTAENVAWALWDGVILGVYEPVSLVIKMILHDLMGPFDPRGYRVLSLVLHSINACLAFGVGRAFLASVNDYGFHGDEVERLIRDRERVVAKLEGSASASASASSSPPPPPSSSASDTPGNGGGGNLTKRRKGGKGQLDKGDAGVGATDRQLSAEDQLLAEARASLERARSSLTYLRTHEAAGTVLCVLGTAVFAVHPLQAQALGWISCISYMLSCFFALLSFGSYVRHRTGLREWRRSRRRRVETASDQVEGKDHVVGRSSIAEPWRILPAAARENKRGKAGRQFTTSSSVAVIGEDESEAWLLTGHKAKTLVFYALATFCKSPSVTLPLVFVIADVFLYSCPLSVHPSGPAALMGAVGGERSTSAVSSKTVKQRKDAPPSPGFWESLLPHRAVPKFCNEAFPSLLRLTLRALHAWTVFLFAAVLMTVFLVRGNTKTLLDVLTPFEKLEKSMWALSWYVAKLVVPTNLVAAVERHSFSLFDHWEVATSMLVVPYATLVVLANSLSSARGRVLACAWGTFIALLLPSLGFIQHGRMFLAADRYMYIPLVIFGPLLGAIAGSCVTICADAPHDESLHAGGPVPATVAASSGPIDAFDSEKISGLIGGKNRGKGGGKSKGRTVQTANGASSVTPEVKFAVKTAGLMSSVGVAAVLCVYAVSTTPYNYYSWRTTLLLWSKNVELFPNTENAHVNLSGVYTNDKNHLDLDKAVYHAKIAVEMRPSSAKYQANLGILYGRRNEMVEAKKILTKALRDHPRSIYAPIMHKVLGQALRTTGEWQDALRELEIAYALGDKSVMLEIEKLMEQRKDPANEAKQREKWRKQRDRQLAGKEYREKMHGTT